MSAAALAAAASALEARFPDVDRVTIEETLGHCEGDAEKCADVLTQVLAEEAASQPPSAMRSLFDVVSVLCALPPSEQPAEARAKVLQLCNAMETTGGIRVTRPVTLLLDGERDPLTVGAGLDEADRVVALRLLELIRSGGGGTLDGLSASERSELTAEFATSTERSEAMELEKTLTEKSKVLAAKEQELKELKAKAIRHRMAAEQQRGFARD